MLPPPAARRSDFTLQRGDVDADPRAVEQARMALATEVNPGHARRAGEGHADRENGERVVSVSVPIQHVKAVLGVLVLEASDVDEIIAAERGRWPPSSSSPSG